MTPVVQNTVFNVASFGVAAVVGVALVPVIIHGYGLEVLGLVALSRAVLPNGMAGILDLGMPEALLQSVASRRGKNQTPMVLSELAFAASVLALIGLTSGVALWLCAHWISESWLRLAGATSQAFTEAVRWTAVVLVALFPAQLLEALLKGREQFLLLRGMDVATAVLYGGGVVGLVIAQAGFQWVIYLYLTLQIVRGLAFAIALNPALREQGSRTSAWSRRALLSYGFAAQRNKAIGIGLLYLPQLVVASLLGVRASGLFEAVSRIPYLFKSLLGFGTLAIVPAAARRAAGSSHGAFREKLVPVSSVFAMVFLPPLINLAVFSDRLLETWLGQGFAGVDGWFAVLMVWPACIACYQVMDAGHS